MKLTKFSTVNLLKDYEISLNSLELSNIVCALSFYDSEYPNLDQTSSKIVSEILELLRIYRDL